MIIKGLSKTDSSEDAYVHLMSLLDGAFGIEEHEVKHFFSFKED